MLQPLEICKVKPCIKKLLIDFFFVKIKSNPYAQMRLFIGASKASSITRPHSVNFSDAFYKKTTHH